MSQTNTLRRFLGGLCILTVGGALLSACGGGAETGKDLAESQASKTKEF